MKVQILNYKGNVVANWRVPKTRRQLTWTAVKLVRLYYRCKESGLLTNELIQVMQEFLEAFKDKLLAVAVAHPEIARGIKEIRSLRLHDLEEEIITEKVRRHEQAVCSLCRTNLRYPAYVVYRKGLEIVRVSNPVGIFCLKATAGKLKDLIVQVKVDASVQHSPKPAVLSLPFAA